MKNVNMVEYFAGQETEDTSYRTAMLQAEQWEHNPDRWKSDRDERPDQAPDVSEPSYHQHPLEYLTLWWEQCPFSPRFQLVLDRLHAVWVKDQDPRAIAMELTEEGDYRFLERVQVNPTSSYRARGEELEAIIWAKIQVMLELVAEHLASKSELTQQDQEAMVSHQVDLEDSRQQAAKMIANRE